MGKIRRGNDVFITWKGDHGPKHVHVYRHSKLVTKWDLEAQAAMKGRPTVRILEAHPPAREGGRAVKIRRVTANNRKKAFEVATLRRVYVFPFAKADPPPTSAHRVTSVFVDREAGGEAFTYVLASGKEGTVHLDHVLEYNEDPRFMRDLLLYRLTLEAQKRVRGSALSTRELIRRLGTSPAQFYRLLDQTNYRKSVDQLLTLLSILDCEVELIVKGGASRGTSVVRAV